MLEVDISRDERYEKIPERFIDDIEEYMNYGTIDNKMLMYILQNDLRSVCRRHRGGLAFAQIRSISLCAYNQVPSIFYGDPRVSSPLPGCRRSSRFEPIPRGYTDGE